MKKLDNLSTWLFLLLTVILFLFALSMIFDKSLDLKFYPWDKEKFRYYLTIDDSKSVEEKIIPLAVFFNREDSEVYSWIGDYFERKGDLLKAVEYYQKAIIFNPLDNYDLYKKKLKIDDRLGRRKEKEELLSALFRALEYPAPPWVGMNEARKKPNRPGKLRPSMGGEVSFVRIERTKNLSSFGVHFAKEVYLLGEDFLKSGDYNKAIYWWAKAKEILPEWSYFHLETASLYQKLGEEDKVKEVLNNCLKYFFPKEHCQSYLDKKVIEVEEPGFWRDKILAIPNY